MHLCRIWIWGEFFSHSLANVEMTSVQFSVFKQFSFQFSIFRQFSFQIFKFLPVISQRDFKFQISVFNFQYSHIQIQTVQFSKFQILDASYRDFKFQFSTLSIHKSQFRHFQFSQYSHIGIQTFQFSKFQIPNIPCIVVPWQVWHMHFKQLINFEYSVSKNKILLKFFIFLPKELVFGIKY